MNKKIRYFISAVLLIGIVLILISIFIGYNINPNEAYSIDKSNLIEDGSFENFNKTVGDCCNANPNMSRVYASKSEDSFIGNFSLNLTSEYQCACSSFPVKDFNNKDRYFLSFYYKGNNPRFCNWVNGDKKCLPNKKLESTNNWNKNIELLKFTEISTSASIFSYADNPKGDGTVTNLYDDLQVHKLIPIENPSEYEYNSEEEYIFKTKADNNVKGEIISEVDTKTGEAYFIVKGKPAVTIKFPLSEIVIIVIMILIVVRLLFKKQVLQTEEEIKREVDKIIKSDGR